MLLLQKIGPHHMQIGQLEGVELFGQEADERDGIAVFHAVEAVQRRQAHAHAVAADGGGHGSQHFKQEARAVLQRAAVAVGAVVRAVAQELVDEVAVGCVHFHAIKACGDGVFGALHEGFDDAGDFRLGEHMRGHMRHFASGGVDVALDGCGGGRHGGRAAVDGRVRSAARVPDLHVDAPALGVHGGGDLLPGGHLLWRVDTRLCDEGRGVGGHHGALSDQQATAGTLGVVLGHEGVGHVARICACAGQRREQDAVRNRESANLQGIEECGVHRSKRVRRTGNTKLRTAACVHHWRGFATELSAQL